MTSWNLWQIRNFSFSVNGAERTLISFKCLSLCFFNSWIRFSCSYFKSIQFIKNLWVWLKWASCIIFLWYELLYTLKLFVFFFAALVLTKAFRIVMLDVPSPTTLGESVELTCSYELDDEQLYSVKWYKNEVEFYRYVPNDWPPGQFLPLPGIKVDVSKEFF